MENLTAGEIKTIQNFCKYNNDKIMLPCVLFILASEIYIWVKYFAYLTSNWKVAMYNAVIYGSVAFGIIYGYFYGKKIEKIFRKILSL